MITMCPRGVCTKEPMLADVPVCRGRLWRCAVIAAPHTEFGLTEVFGDGGDAGYRVVDRERFYWRCGVARWLLGQDRRGLGDTRSSGGPSGMPGRLRRAELQLGEFCPAAKAVRTVETALRSRGNAEQPGSSSIRWRRAI